MATDTSPTWVDLVFGIVVLLLVGVGCGVLVFVYDAL